MSESVPSFDLYAELKVSADAPTEVIAAAHRALVRQSHPDLSGHGGADERTKRLNVARDWLMDAQLRARYDRTKTRPPIDHRPRTAQPAREVVLSDGSWDRSPARAELDLFVERCGRLSSRDLRRLATAYRRDRDGAEPHLRAGERLAGLCHEWKRDRVVAVTATEALARAESGGRILADPIPAILRWTAFGIAMLDVAPMEAQLLLTPWRAMTARDAPPSQARPSRWLAQLGAAIVALAVLIELVRLGAAPAPALIIAGVGGTVLAKLLERAFDRIRRLS